jgi:predicted  nucleic acid-binding Zn-ribbon protein
MLNWRRDPGYEQKMLHYEQRKMQHEQRMNDNRIAIERSKERTKQLEKEILRVRSDREQIEKEIELLDHENAKERALSDSIRRLCFPPESSSIPQTSIEPGSKPSLPS